MLENKKLLTRFISIILLVCLALFSFFFISDYASSPSTHTQTIQTLDEKKMNALELSAAVAATSTAISAIPGDTATPIANQLSELTTPLLLVVCALYLEKFLLTTTGYVAFKFLLPIASFLMIAFLIVGKEFFRTLAYRIAVLGLAIYLIVPFSVVVTNFIDNTFEASINQTFETVDEITQEAEKANENNDSNGFMDFLNGITSGVTNFVESAKNALSKFVDAIAVLIITTCVIPILVFVVIIWIVKNLFNINFDSKKIKQFKLIDKKTS
ncbi:MAG: hypothetical protein ACI4U3_06210 [Traorella sp.]